MRNDDAYPFVTVGDDVEIPDRLLDPNDRSDYEKNHPDADLRRIGGFAGVRHNPFRPSRLGLMLSIVDLVATRSTCERLRVGTLITSPDLTCIYAFGYNGTAAGLPNECERPNDPGNCGDLHAECNALIKAPYGPPLTMISTHAPCVACAKLIINSSVEMLIFKNMFRTNEGIDLLTQRLGWKFRFYSSGEIACQVLNRERR